jgi:hypothetical protein
MASVGFLKNAYPSDQVFNCVANRSSPAYVHRRFAVEFLAHPRQFISEQFKPWSFAQSAFVLIVSRSPF